MAQDSEQLSVSYSSFPDSALLSIHQAYERRIALRAYELFARRYYADGHDLDDWLSAESEFLQPVPVELREAENSLTLKVEVPGFAAKDINVNIEPYRVYVCGIHEENIDNKNPGETADSEHFARKIFRAIDLPAEVDPSKVKLNFDNGELDLVLTKAEAAKKDVIEQKAA